MATTEKTMIVSTSEANKIVDDLLELKRHAKELKRKEDALKQKLYNYMGEHDIMVNCETGEEFVSWTYSEGYMKFDSKKFADDKPKIYEKYCKMTDGVRTLRISK